MSLRERLAALLGISTYQAPPTTPTTLDSASVESVRKAMGGQLTMLPQTQLRWYLEDLESAIHNADAGNIEKAAQVWGAAKRDGTLAGLLSTLTGGIVGLPRRWTGDKKIVDVFEGRDGVASVYDNLAPSAESALMVGDGAGIGISVGELLKVDGRDYPVLCRLDPRWLFYRWNENTWYYLSIAGAIPITPGDGHWVLHVPGGRVAPWQNGLWYPIGNAFINKQHAKLHKSNWEGKLANPARVAVSPQGASEDQEQSWFEQVMAWGVNTVFGLKSGYDVKLLESNGRGFESFDGTVAQAEREFIIAIAGQLVTVDGGAGFANADIHKSIRADIIRAQAEAWAHTVNTQILPSVVVNRFGIDALKRTAVIEYDTKPPKDLKESAEATGAFGDAVTKANTALAPYGLQVDATELASQFGIPLKKSPAIPTQDESSPSIDQTVEDDAPNAEAFN